MTALAVVTVLLLAVPGPLWAQEDTTAHHVEDSLRGVIHGLEDTLTYRDTSRSGYEKRLGKNREAKRCSAIMLALAGVGYLVFKDDRPLAAFALGSSALIGCLWD